MTFSEHSQVPDSCAVEVRRKAQYEAYTELM